MHVSQIEKTENEKLLKRCAGWFSQEAGFEMKMRLKEVYWEVFSEYTPVGGVKEPGLG